MSEQRNSGGGAGGRGEIGKVQWSGAVWRGWVVLVLGRYASRPAKLSKSMQDARAPSGGKWEGERNAKKVPAPALR
jgi:hypothetical protein